MIPSARSHCVLKRALAAVAAAALSSMAGGASAAEVFKIGLIADYTGAFATWGPQFEHAIAAYQAINGKTVKGPKGEDIEVQLVPRDVGSAGPDKAKQLAEELVLREKVNMLAGFDLSPHALAVAPIISEVKIPTVIMNAATASITRASPYFVRTSYTLPQWSASMAKWAAQQGYKRIYTVVSDYAPGYDAEAYFQKVFKESGGAIVGSARTPIQETNFASYMEKVLEAKPDAFYSFQPGGSPSIALVKAFLERGLKAAGIKFLGNGEFDPTYLPNFSDDVIGSYSVNHYTETNTFPENVEMRDQIHKMYGPKAPTEVASVAAWDGIKLIYLALHENGAHADGLKYIASMTGKTFQSPRGTFMIDPAERDIVQNMYIREVRKVDGELANVDIATIPMVKDPWKQDNPAKK